MELDLLKEIKPNRQKALFLAKRQLAEFVYDAINLEGIHYTLPVKRQLEFNTLMLDFYHTGNKTAMTEFMLSCLDKKAITIMSE